MKPIFHQIIPCYSRHDAISTEAKLIQAFLITLGFQSEIFSEQGSGIDGVKSAKSMQLKSYVMDPNSSLMLHFSIASQLTVWWQFLKCRKILRFHNITPHQFFTSPDEIVPRIQCSRGESQIRYLSKFSDIFISASKFNASSLDSNCQKPSFVIPVFRDYQALCSKPMDSNLQNQLKSNHTMNILFVGRIAPNKCQHDLLQALALLKPSISQKIRVIFAGGFFSKSYSESISNFASSLNLTLAHHWNLDADVLSLGSISDHQLSTLYKSSDLYLSMSEHEGFGVPIVESMYFDLPVAAHSAAAIPEILGQSPLLFNKWNWIESIQLIKAALTDDAARKKEIARAQLWRDQFNLQNCQSLLKQILDAHHKL